MMRAILVLAGAALGSAAAAERGVTVRPTELKARPFADAATLATLDAQAPVEVLQRQSSWLQVKADRKRTGWIKLLSLRFAPLEGKATGINDNLNVVFNLGQAGSGGSTATTGVKGISEEALANPHAAPAQLAQMQAMTVDAAAVQAFAHAGKLAARPVPYLASPADQHGGQP
jgi:hypothetical protein